MHAVVGVKEGFKIYNKQKKQQQTTTERSSSRKEKEPKKEKMEMKQTKMGIKEPEKRTVDANKRKNNIEDPGGEKKQTNERQNIVGDGTVCGDMPNGKKKINGGSDWETTHNSPPGNKEEKTTNSP